MLVEVWGFLVVVLNSLSCFVKLEIPGFNSFVSINVEVPNYDERMGIIYVKMAHKVVIRIDIFRLTLGI